MLRDSSPFRPSCNALLDEVTERSERLSTERQIELHAAMKAGCLDSRDKLLYSVLPYAFSYVNRFVSFSVSKGIQVDDLFAEAVLMTLEYVERCFDPSKGRLTTGLSWWLRTRINDYVQCKDQTIRSRNVRNRAKMSEKTKRKSFLSSCTTTIGGMDYSSREDPPLLDSLERLDVRQSLKCLTSREFQFVTMYFYDDMTYKEISKLFGVSKQRVQQVIAAALEKLEPKLKECV